MHAFEQNAGGGDVVVIIQERLRDGFGNGFQPGEMNDGIDGVGFEDFGESLFVFHGGFDEMETFAGDTLNPKEGFFKRVAKIVHDDDFVASFEKGETGMGANVTSTTGD